MNLARLVVATLSGIAFLCAPPAHARRPHASAAHDAAILAACPPAGDARSPRVRSMNLLKRRMTAPTTAEIDPKTTLAAMLAPGYDAQKNEAP